MRIALTHAHGDHVGSLDALAAALPGVEVLISARDARLLAKDKSLDPGEPQDKLRGSYPGARDAADARRSPPGDRVGSLEVHAAPGHTPGQVAFLDPRDGTLYCADAYSTLGGVATTAKAELALPAAGAGDLAQADGAGDRPGAARARPGAARARPRQGRRGAGRRDGPRDRARGLSVPRRGLDRAQVVDAAAAIADADGLEAVTLARVAAALGVRSPSLYNHVAGRDGPARAASRARATRELAAALRRAATGRAGADAIAAVADAQRAYARAHPGRYAATVRGAGAGRRRARGGGRRGGRRAHRRARRRWGSPATS